MNIFMQDFFLVSATASLKTIYLRKMINKICKPMIISYVYFVYLII